MLLRVKAVTHFGHNRHDTMLAEDADQLAHGQLDAFHQTACSLPRCIISMLEGTTHVVIDRQQIAGQLGAAILLGLTTIAIGTFAHVFRLGHGAEHAVTQLVTLGLERGDDLVSTGGRFLFGRKRHLGRLVIVRVLILKIFVFSLAHNFLMSGLSGPVRNQPANQLCRIIHNRNDPPVVQARGADDPNCSDDLSIRVHIGRDHQRGTRK
mmetsp:Transcript_3516/g.6315  ORF Transcript_3516/g.6315 Transcript_3516/m.6315 type:complete len:209 (+) Transcript_3516:476-1102(+)